MTLVVSWKCLPLKPCHSQVRHLNVCHLQIDICMDWNTNHEHSKVFWLLQSYLCVLRQTSGSHECPHQVDLLLILYFKSY